jgi:hypothetical protein
MTWLRLAALAALFAVVAATVVVGGAPALAVGINALAWLLSGQMH